MIPKKELKLESCIRSIPDFPKTGILFRDITTLLNNKEAFSRAVDLLAAKFKGKKIDYVVAIESRGFIFGGALAVKLKAGFVPVRKKGKLPAKTYSASYSLEYGTDNLEIHQDAFPSGSRVLIVDDLLATGGTVKAVTELVYHLRGKIVGFAFLIELVELKGRDQLSGYPAYSLIKY
jgi:adenine phosphoribosyltransferase